MNLNNGRVPVRIEFGIGKLDHLRSLVSDRAVLLVTTQGFVRRGVAARAASLLHDTPRILAETTPNPTFKDIERQLASLQGEKFGVIVGIGGGSVLDTAKALAVGLQQRDPAFIERLLKKELPELLYPALPVIAVPTTAGTGSEVTPWATIWDDDAKKKHSLQQANLWPESCICDPELTLTVPREITVQTGLDALSHSLESIWNKNADAVSRKYAVEAAKIILADLPRLARNLGNLELRSSMLRAALLAGLAFSSTKTALAHAISYYVTANKGVPHGIACSFTLPDILDRIGGKDVSVDSALSEIFGTVNGDRLREMYRELGVSTHFEDYGVRLDEMQKIRDSLAGNDRAGNSLVAFDEVFRS